MGATLEEKILEFSTIAGHCPDKFQEKCFELLLNDYLSQLKKGSSLSSDNISEINNPENVNSQEFTEKNNNPSEEILLADLHIKARKFLEKNNIDITLINGLFYKNKSEIEPLYDNLMSSKTSESQIRIALLQSLLNGLKSGDFSFEIESVRNECDMRKCYDKNNFSSNFKNNINLFDVDNYNKNITKMSLSEKGKNKLSDLVRELQ